MKKLCYVLCAVLMLATVTACQTDLPATTEPVAVTTEQPTSEPETLPETVPTSEPVTTEPISEPATENPTAATTAKTEATTVKTEKTEKTTAATTKKTTNPYVGYSSYQLIPDPDFENGLTINHWLSGAPVDTWEPAGLSTDKTAWSVAQWGTKRCLWADNISKKSNILDDGYKRLTYNKKEKSLALYLDSFDILDNDVYDASSGYTWPHLLIEQGDFGYKEGSKTAPFFTGKADHMIFSLDMRINSYENINYGGPNNCQLVAFFYVHAAGGGFVWFGVPLFESRDFYTQTSPYYALDVASNSYIYTLPFHYGYEAFELGDIYHDEVTRLAQADTRWNHYEIDLKPWFEKMANLALNDGFFPEAKSAEDLYINGMNLGYEMGSCFAIETEFKNIRLTSYIKE